MINLSSAFTIVFKLFLPLFWFVFFGSWLFVIFFTKEAQGSIMSHDSFRYAFLIFVVAWILFMYLTVWQLLRVDADSEKLVATNFFKAYRYSVSNIVKVTTLNLFVVKIKTIHFKDKGYFGKKVSVLVSKKRWSIYEEEVLIPAGVV